MRVNLLFGFLGSGKTTLLQRILRERGADGNMAVIVNEFGDVSVDGALLEGANVDMIELTSGCLCCTLKGPLLGAIEELRTKAGVEQVVVESTGVAQPGEMLETLSDPSFTTDIELGPIVTVVDAAKFDRLQQALGEFYVAQVEDADVVVLNKVDLSTPEALDQLREEVQEINPDASVMFAEQCDVDLGLVLDGGGSRTVDGFAESSGHQHDHDHDDDGDHGHHHGNHAHAPADSFVLHATGNRDRGQIRAFFAALPDNVWRVKGFMVVDGEPSLVQFTMGQLEITPAPGRDNPLLVVIGRDLDRGDIESRFALAMKTNDPSTATAVAGED